MKTWSRQPCFTGRPLHITKEVTIFLWISNFSSFDQKHKIHIMDFQIVQRKYIGLVNRVTQPDGNRIQFHLPVEWTFSTYHLTLPLGHLFKSQMWWKFTAQPMWDWDCPLFCKNISVSVWAENYSAGGNIDKCRWQSCAILVQNWLQQNFPVHGNQCLHRGPRMGNNFTAIRNANHSWRRGNHWSAVSGQILQ